MNDPKPLQDAPDDQRAAGKEDAAVVKADVDMIDIAYPLATSWRSLILVPAAATLLVYGATFLLKPLYTGSTTFLPPQQQGNLAASALSSLGALGAIAGASIKSPAEQYVSLMQSTGIADHMIDRFHLMSQYDARYREDARKKLAKLTSISVGKKDGLITVEVEDIDPKRAAAMANSYVDELRLLTSHLAVSEAQQRRAFFENQMQLTKDKLVAAQQAMQESGFTLGALKAEPRAAAESYANLRAQLTTAEVKLEMMRSSLAETNAEVVQQKAVVQSLQAKTDALEASIAPDNSKESDYVGKYREFKYQETLFEQMARQYEIARVDEAREGALIQVVDPAQPPERRSSPKRTMIALGAGMATALLYAMWLVLRDRFRSSLGDERFAGRVARLHAATRRR
jgi:uncharacterized protein involved in exopolysaccharide biosynthesis